MTIGLAAPRQTWAAAPRSPRLYVQALGDALPEAHVDLVLVALRVMLAAEPVRLARVALPAKAYYPPRKRYRAERLLEFLDTQIPADGTQILGLTGVDISTTKGRVKDWGVLGLGELPGTACVISSFRCRRGARDPRHAAERLAKVAVHEVGHTLGLPHCPTRGCLMEDARGLVATSDREYDLCSRCRRLVAEAGHPLPVAPRFPWPRPSR